MDSYVLSKILKKSSPINKVEFIQNECRGKDVLDLGCVKHTAIFAQKDPDWLHRKIRDVAAEILGVDYLSDEVEKLKKIGYNVICADVTKPLELSKQFDVIVAGDLIEHLSNFDGFFTNCSRLLKQDGKLIITTPNPFFTDVFHFTSFKKRYFVNPEHTCWIDPQTLSQLSERFGFFVNDVHFIQKSWKLKNYILDSESFSYDFFSGKWTNESRLPRLYLFRDFFMELFNFFYATFILMFRSNSTLVKYSDYLAILKKGNLKANDLSKSMLSAK